jgi:hypothetical protein
MSRRPELFYHSNAPDQIRQVLSGPLVENWKKALQNLTLPALRMSTSKEKWMVKTFFNDVPIRAFVDFQRLDLA